MSSRAELIAETDTLRKKTLSAAQEFLGLCRPPRDANEATIFLPASRSGRTPTIDKCEEEISKLLKGLAGQLSAEEKQNLTRAYGNCMNRQLKSVSTADLAANFSLHAYTQLLEPIS